MPTDDEIKQWRWHQEMVATENAHAVLYLLGKPLVDPDAQAAIRQASALTNALPKL